MWRGTGIAGMSGLVDGGEGSTALCSMQGAPPACWSANDAQALIMLLPRARYAVGPQLRLDSVEAGLQAVQDKIGRAAASPLPTLPSRLSLSGLLHSRAVSVAIKNNPVLQVRRCSRPARVQAASCVFAMPTRVPRCSFILYAQACLRCHSP